MRARILMLILSAAFAVASRSQAAAVDISVVQEGPGSTSWDLRVSLGYFQSLAGLGLMVSDSLSSFTPYSPGPPLSCLSGVSGCMQFGPPGFNLLSLQITPPLFSFGSTLLGTFRAVSPDALVQVLPGDAFLGGTAFDSNGFAIADYSIQVVPAPEPEVSTLWALALALGPLGARASRAWTSTTPGST